MSLGEPIILAKVRDLLGVFLVDQFSHDLVPIRDRLTILFFNSRKVRLSAPILAGHSGIVG